MQAMFAWVATVPSGLFAEEMEIIEGAGSAGEKSIEDKYARHAQSSKHCLLDHTLMRSSCWECGVKQDH